MSEAPLRPPACPHTRVLENIVAGREGSEEAIAQAHLASCPVCRGQLDQIRANNDFLAEIQDVAATESSLAPADLVPGYQILGEIHRGGQGVVYKAIQNDTRRKVAIKLLLRGRSAVPRQRIRFEQEIALAASLRHPNIVAVHDSVRPRDGWLGYAMEYVSGRPLDEWARGTEQKTAPSLDEKVRLFIKVCDAVQYAHRRGIIHRDLKPGNILVDADGEPRLCDFGVAKIAEGKKHGPKTVTGEFVGTLAYASPEQVSGSPDLIDTRSDVYSLGVVLYEAIIGQMPYAVDVPVSDAVHNIASTAPRSPSTVGVRIATDLQIIIFKALAKEPERRYQSAQRLGDDLRRSLQGEAIEARRSSGWYVLRKTARRHWVPVAVAAGVLAVVLAAAIRERAQAANLRVTLSNASVERGRARVELGNIPEAESLLWSELLDAPAGAVRWAPDDERLPLSRAWWALWELYAAHPCAATVRVAGPLGPAAIKLLRPVPGHRDLVLIAGDAGTLGLWTLPDFTLRAKTSLAVESGQDGPPPGFSGVAAFTPADEIVAHTQDDTLRRWDATTLEPHGPPLALQTTSSPSWSNVSISADGRRFARMDASTIWLIDPSATTPPELLQPTDYPPNKQSMWVLLSPDGEWLAYADVDGFTLRGLGSAPSTTHFPFAQPNVMRQFVFTKNVGTGELRFFFTAVRTIWMLEPRIDNDVRPFAVVDGVSSLYGIALSADGRWLAAAGDARRLSLWDARGDRGIPVLRSMATHDANVTSLTFTPDNRSLLAGYADGIVQRWDISDLPPSPRRGAFTPLLGHTDSVFAVAIDGTSGVQRAYSGAYDCTVRAWDLTSGEEKARSAPLGGTIESIALSPDGKTVAAAIDLGDDSDVVLLDAATLQHEHTRILAHAGRCADLTFSPDGRNLATVGDDGWVRRWDVSSGKKMAERSVPNPRGEVPLLVGTRTVRFSPRGDTLGWGGVYGVTSLNDTAFARPPMGLLGNRDIIRCLRFSPDGRRVVAAGDDSTVWVWDASAGRVIHEMKGHVGRIFALAISPDGRILASGGGDGTVRLWDAATGENLSILRDNPPQFPEGLIIFALEFTPDGSSILTGGSKGYLGLWDLRHYERHIAGNLEYWADRLKETRRPSPIAGAAKRWAEDRTRAPEAER